MMMIQKPGRLGRGSKVGEWKGGGFQATHPSPSLAQHTAAGEMTHLHRGVVTSAVAHPTTPHTLTRPFTHITHITHACTRMHTHAHAPAAATSAPPHRCTGAGAAPSSVC